MVHIWTKTYWMDSSEPYDLAADTSGTGPSIGTHEEGDQAHDTPGTPQPGQDAKHEQDTMQHIMRTEQDR